MTKENEIMLAILRDSLWGRIDGEDNFISESIRQELMMQKVEGLPAIAYPDGSSLRYEKLVKFVQMVSAQCEVLELLQKADIPVVVIKGTAAGIYYPYPFLRSYGDIDILVDPKDYKRAIELFVKNEYIQLREEERYHTAFRRGKYIIELHQSPPGLDDIKQGSYILEYLLSGMQDIQTGQILQPACEFPMLPWRQNGLELIWHIREHLYNGLGLRQIIDWMLFVNHYLDDETFLEYGKVLEEAGLAQLAKAVTKTCQIYLGLTDDITWCSDVEESLCEKLIGFIIDQGDFGNKRIDDKAAKVVTRYNTPAAFFRGMQRKGLKEWELAHKYRILRPLAWIYIGIQGIQRYISKGGVEQLIADRKDSLERRDMFAQLYGDSVKTSDHQNIPASSSIVKGLSEPKTRINDRFSEEKPRSHAKKSIKQIARPLYEFLKKTTLRGIMYNLEELYYAIRYPLLGRPDISLSDVANVERNVTFIYKSFNRQKKAARLYKCIKSYYPNARVIIADDSREQLVIEGIESSEDVIVQLPFNSGLSKGIIAALEKVETPYVMRMDDDELLTPKTNVHGQLAYLEAHPGVDLVGVQATHRNPEAMADLYSAFRMGPNMIVPEKTMIDGKEVVGKTANVFLARTDKIRKIGYDANIRMLDHHEFFTRAAGVLVCVQDRSAYIMHCHNHFEDPEKYGKYRRDYQGDVQYIYRKK